MDEDHTAPSVGMLFAAGSAILFVAYWAIFALTADDGLERGGVQAFNNTAPAIVLAWLTHLVLERHIWPARPWRRLAAHLPLSILFALAWYVAILVIRELRDGALAQGFRIVPFPPTAFAWQMFQGVTVYALTALASLAIVLRRRLDAIDAIAALERSVVGPEPARGDANAILLRTGDGAETVQTTEIVSISGAGDCCEIVLAGRTIVSTTTLAEFERRLPPESFIRAHRSHIVALRAVARSEPAGNGRTVLHLSDGRSLVTSRAGTAALREAAL